VDNSPKSANCAELVARMKQNIPPVPVTAAHGANAGRNRAVGSELARSIQRGGNAGIEAGMSRDTRAGVAQFGASRDITKPTLAGSADRLLADARNACQREGISATRRDLLARVAKRVSLSQPEVACRLGGTVRRGGAEAASTVADMRHRRDPVSRLAARILGAREREVFLARRDARPDDVVALHQLAARIGLSVERVYELEASARHKLDISLG